jgi:hypothetical protein
MERGNERSTGTRDVTYDIISVLYHALESADTCSRYCEDAEEEGNEDLINFFEHVIDVNREVAERAKSVLMKELQSAESESVGESKGEFQSEPIGTQH